MISESMTDCPSVHPEHGACRAGSGNHQTHIAGYGDSLVEWENEDYIPPPPRTSIKRMYEIAQDLRRSPV